MPDKGGIQLLPETRKKIEVKVPGEHRFIYIGSALLAVVVVAFVVLKGMTRNLEGEIRNKNAQIVQLTTARNTETEEQLIALSKQTKLINEFLKSHVFWSTALNKIQQALQQQVQIAQLSALADSNEITFTAKAPDYTTIARQIASFVSDDGLKDVQITNARSSNEGQFEFGVKLIFDPTKYLKK
jgi:predicted regulator of amino acid metabolism with ACT domain